LAAELASQWQQASNVKLLRQPPQALLTAKQIQTYDRTIARVHAIQATLSAVEEACNKSVLLQQTETVQLQHLEAVLDQGLVGTLSRLLAWQLQPLRRPHLQAGTQAAQHHMQLQAACHAGK
jgi:hypothetical protein